MSTTAPWYHPRAACVALMVTVIEAQSTTSSRSVRAWTAFLVVVAVERVEIDQTGRMPADNPSLRLSIDHGLLSPSLISLFRRCFRGACWSR